MKPNATALAVSLLSSVLLLNAQAATAQTTSPPSATATRPATTPPGQTSLPNESPPATTTQTTGEASRLELKPDRSTIAGDGHDIAFVTLTVVDKDGLPVPRSKNPVRSLI